MAFSNFYSIAFGIGTRNQKGEWLEVFYPVPMFQPSDQDVERYAQVLGYSGGNQAIELNEELIGKLAGVVSDSRQQAILGMMRQSNRPRVVCLLETDGAIESTPEAYLKLHHHSDGYEFDTHHPRRL